MKTIEYYTGVDFKIDDSNELFFEFTDGEGDDGFNEYEDMKNYTENRYQEQYKNEIFFSALNYNSKMNTYSVLDTMFVGMNYQENKCIEFAERVIKKYVK